MTAPELPRPPWASALRQARLEAGWDAHRLAIELLRAAGPEATASAESLTRRIREWEAGRSTIRERYRLLLAHVLQLDADWCERRPGPGSEAEQVRAVTRGLITLDELTGGTDLVAPAVRNAHAAHQALRADPVPGMASAAAEALQVAGWLAFDADSGLLARRLTSSSVLTARAGRDAPAELFALSQLAMQDAHEQRPDQARGVCEHALDQDLPPRVRGLFELRLARAQGQEGTPARALETLNRARSRLRGESQDRDPPWTWWVSEAELDWHEAMIHGDCGQWPQAVPLLESALHGRPGTYRRGALNDAAHLLNALTRLDSWKAAEQVLRNTIVPGVEHVHSGRTQTLLGRIRSRVAERGGPVSLKQLVELTRSPRLPVS
ncbi:hypothetical protein [Nocardiopsis sp. JB363]|uniref:hypothetical protein n=1 Tax=Nocardiopsis sp. JB363 TaxID=1434837 RepID=UPI000B35A656|nr:hypothetical protein [Nocardiopsis sp. JB363]